MEIYRAAALQEILKVRLGLKLAADLQYVAGNALWMQLDVVARTVPEVALASEQVFCFILAAFGDLQSIKRQIHKAGLGIVGVEVNHDEDQVRFVLRLLAVADNLLVIRGIEFERPIALERRMGRP